MNEDQAKKIYSVTPELRDTILKDFSDEQLGIKPVYAKKWEELEVGRDSYYVSHDSRVLRSPLKLENGYKNSLPTREKAESVSAYCQLSMVYHQYPKGEFEYIGLGVYSGYTVKLDMRTEDVMCAGFVWNKEEALVRDFCFYSKELCQEFIDNNRELLLTWLKGR